MYKLYPAIYDHYLHVMITPTKIIACAKQFVSCSIQLFLTSVLSCFLKNIVIAVRPKIPNTKNIIEGEQKTEDKTFAQLIEDPRIITERIINKKPVGIRTIKSGLFKKCTFL